MRTLVTCLCLAIAVSLAGGCSKKVSEENARKVQPGMSLAEVKAILGSGRKDGADVYEWTTDKGGKLRITFTNDKVTRIETQGVARNAEQEDKDRAQTDAKWAEQKKEADRISQDRDRINALNDVHALLFAAVGAGDKLPANEAAAAASPLAEVNGGMAAIRSGRVVVRWGAPYTDAIWAYEKDAPAAGGYVVGEKYHHAEKLTAEQLRPLLKP